MARLIGIDVGTTSCKAVLINDEGVMIDQCSIEYPLYTPQPGWTEQSPEDWWNAASSCIAQLGEYDAIGFSGQMHGSVFLDENDEVIRPALLWNDQRTAHEVREMEAVLGIDTIRAATCNPPISGFQTPKILWLRNNEPQNFARLRSVLLPKDYVRFRLTGEKLTDVSDASGTGLFDVPNRRWATSLIEKLELDPSIFPRSVESKDLPGAGDQAAAAVGVGSITPTIANLSLGTSGVVFASQDDAACDPHGRVQTFCHANGGWHSMGVMLSCGGALRWTRDTFRFRDFDEMAREARQSGATTAAFYPYLAGERTPHNDPELRARLSGLALSDGRAETAAAVFEGITFALFDGLRALESLRKSPVSRLRATGGGVRSDYWLRLISDAFGVPLDAVMGEGGPAQGAALLAGVFAGVWSSLDDACQVVRVHRSFEPSRERNEVLAARYATWLEDRPRVE